MCPRPNGLRSLPPNTAHPECERSERIEGAIWTQRRKTHRPLDTLAALALGVSGRGDGALEPAGRGRRADAMAYPAPAAVGRGWRE